jgi:hypothetical protein
MVRKRLAFLTALAGLGLLGGCSTTPSCPGEPRPSFLDRFRRHPTECCVEGNTMAAPVGDGPVLTEGASGTVMVPGPMNGGGSCGQPAPLGPAPLAPVPQQPRLVPQPQAQSQPRPYIPQ